MNTQIKAADLYGDKYWYDYTPIVEAIGNVLVRVDDNDYQGDSYVLYYEDGKYGYLNFGWGSCSGCDALQGCSSLEQVQSLIDGMVGSVQWFDSKEECLSYFKNADWEGKYSWHVAKHKSFVQQVIEKLEN